LIFQSGEIFCTKKSQLFNYYSKTKEF